jgi:hypothetical protein
VMMRVLSLGAGVQSSTLLLMAVHGELEIDRAIFADTQWEPKAVYDWLKTLMPIAEKAGIPVDVVTAGNIREAALAGKTESWMPLHIVNLKGEAGLAKRQCTKNYKLIPIRRRVRELIGKKKTARATMVIGISLDEIQRMRDSDVKYLTNEFPLVDRRMSRNDCMAWLERHGYGRPPKSACIGCPYTDNGRWREMRDNRPDEWADVVAFDEIMRDRRHEHVKAYLHRSFVPLPMVDLRTPQDAGQLEMFEGGECDGFSCMGSSL